MVAAPLTEPTLDRPAEDGTAVPLPAPRDRRNDPGTLRQEIVAKLAYSIGKDPIVAQDHDWRSPPSWCARPHHR